MPKIKCRGCETVMNVPDQARGKVVSCKQCGAKTKVPSGGGTPSKKKARKPAGGPGGGLESLNLDELEDEDNLICPYCAAEMDEDDPVCRGCGMNIETGQMDRREAKKRAIRGVNPALFYKNVWGEAASFVKEEWKLALRSGVNWTIYATLFFMCSYLGFVYVTSGPPKTFWIGMTIISFMGIPGWYFWLALKVIEPSVLKEKFRSDRLHTDFFQAIAAGFRAVFWPFIVMGPLTPLAVIAYFALELDPQDLNNQIIAGVLWGAIPLLLLPIAMVHMASRYSYKAWILWELLKVGTKNLGPLLYFFVVAFVAILPVALVAGPLFGLVVNYWNPMDSKAIDNITHGIAASISGDGSRGTAAYYAVKGITNVIATALIVTPIAFVAGFSCLFLMRANGSFGMYNANYLDLVNQMPEGKTATFWVRYLARTVDLLVLPLALFLVAAEGKVMMLGWLMTGVGVIVKIFVPQLFPLIAILWIVYMSWLYWAVQESSQLKSTFGKDAFGLKVIQQGSDKAMTMQQASLKWLVRLVSMILLGIPDLIAAFSPEKRTLGDQVTHSRVVWRGDR